MPKSLLTAIQQIDTLKSDKQIPERALDEILKANLSGEKDAVKTKLTEVLEPFRAFWDEQLGGGEALPDDLDLGAIQPAASKQRVYLGLQDASDEILVTILQHNSEQCRAYLAGREKLWTKPENGAAFVGMLTDEAVEAIQFDAAFLVLRNLISKINDPQLLKDFIDANNKEAFDKAVKKLSEASSSKFPFPEEGLSLFPAAIIPDGLNGLREETNNRWIPLAWKKHSDSLDFDKAARLLKQESFTAYMGTALKLTKDPSPLQYQEARKYLIVSCLQKRFSADRDLDERYKIDVSILNSPEGAGIAEFMKKQINDSADELNDSVEPAVNDNLSLFKALLLPHVLKDVTIDKFNVLAELANAPDLSKFKVGLEKLGINQPADWVTEQVREDSVTFAKEKVGAFKEVELNTVLAKLMSMPETPATQKLFKELALSNDLPAFKKILKDKVGHADVDWTQSKEMTTIQQAACDKILLRQCDNVSSLGGKAHPQLLKAFATLPFDRRNKLLEDNQRFKIRALMEETRTEELGRIFKLSVDDPVITELAKENERLAPFRLLHNTALARVLVGLDEPLISLAEDEVNFINSVLKDNSELNVEILKTSLPEDITKHPKFDGAINSALAEIQKEHRSKWRLLQQVGNELIRPILETFLKLNVDVTYNENSDDIYTQLATALKEQQSAKEFINDVGSNSGLIQDKAQREQLVRVLSLELSETNYAEIQQHRRAFLLNTDDRFNIIAEIAKSLAAIKTQQKTALDSASKLSSFIDSKLFEKGDMTFPAAFDEAVRRRPVAIKAEFDDLLIKTTKIVDYLEANKKILEKHLATLGTAAPGIGSDSEIAKLKSKLGEELAALTNKLDQYRKAEEQIRKMVIEIDRVVSGKRKDVYQGHNVTVTRCTQDDLNNGKLNEQFKKISKGQAPALASAQMGSSAPQEIEGRGELYVHEVVNTNSKDAVFKGVFSQRFDAPEALASGNTRTPNCKVEVLQLPTCVQGDKQKSSPGREDIANFYLNMALAMIVANGGKAPTKDNPVYLAGGSREAMEYLWTAFKVIGEKTNLQFGEDAIKIVSGTFMPSQVKGIFGFNNSSAYKGIFEGSAALTQKQSEVNEMVDGVKKMSKELSDATHNTTSFKNLFQAQKSTLQKMGDKLGTTTSAVEVLNTVVEEIPTTPTSEARSQLATGLRK